MRWDGGSAGGAALPPALCITLPLPALEAVPWWACSALGSCHPLCRDPAVLMVRFCLLTHRTEEFV